MNSENNVASLYADNTVDESQRIFVDVGLWGCLSETHGPAKVIKTMAGGAIIGGPIMGIPTAINSGGVLVAHDIMRDPGRPLTSFGAICGNYIILGDWLGRALGGFTFDLHDRSGQSVELPSKWTRSFLKDMPPKLSYFFTDAQRSTWPDDKPRGYVLNAAYSPVELTPPEEPLIVLPDLHLTLYTGTPSDRFRYKPTNDSDEPVSLDKELGMLLELAKKWDATTVQAGDMYEVWESEILLREQLIGLFLLRQKLLNSGEFYSKQWFGDVNNQLNNILAKGKLLPDLELDFDYVGRIEELENEHSPLRRIISDSSRDGVEFSKTDSILSGIRRAHHELFKEKEKLCDLETRGNHDNRLSNIYWDREFEEGLFEKWAGLKVSKIEVEDFRSRVTVPTEASETGHVPAHFIRRHSTGKGGEARIWIEHGHIYDWHNNDKDWARGFKVVVKKSITKGGIAQEMGIGWGGEVADIGEFEMRYPEFRRTDQIYCDVPYVRLVIMGHTHTPIIRVRARKGGVASTSFFWGYKNDPEKGNPRQYAGSKYWQVEEDTKLRERAMVLEEPLE